MRARLGTILMVAALALLVVGSAATYVEAKPKDKGKSGDHSSSTKKPTPPGTGQPGATTPGASQGVKNSGSIKVAQIGSGTEPDNGAKPGCTFRVDFYGFRAGVLDVTVSAIAPTGDATVATDQVTLSTSARGNEYQASRTYDVSGALGGLTASDQGYHLRVDVKRTDSHGNGSKSKVFWLDCAPETQVQGTYFERSNGVRVLGLRTANGVLGADGRRVAVSDGSVLEVLGVDLARTGAPLKGLSLLAIALAMLGASLLLLAQPRPQH